MLNKVWPWKKSVETYIDRHGELKDLVTANILPAEYETVTGLPAMTLFCVVLMLVGFAFVLILDHFGNKATAKN